MALPLLACGEPLAPRDAPSAPAAELAPAGPSAEVRSARRCGECHESYLTEWSGSAHAGSDRSPVYQAMRAAAPEAVACDRCHAPLAAVLGRSDPLASEGVSCEVCHAIAAVELEPASARWTLQLSENRKYGPLCDVEEPYFHRAGCSPLHGESRLCAACHHLNAPLPVFSEFAEWQHGEAMSSGLHCQGCHMPKLAGVVASGGPGRRGVSQHGDGPALGDALQLSAAAVAVADDVELRGALKVSGAGHSVPAGLPGRELALVAELVDGTGHVTARAELVYSKRLVDADGREVPFYAATQVGADTRLQADETRAFVLRLPGAHGGARAAVGGSGAAGANAAANPAAAPKVVLRLVERPLSRELAQALQLELPARELQVLRFAAPWGRAP